VKASTSPPSRSIARAISDSSSVAGALEENMLQKMGDPLFLGVLILRTGAHEEPGRANERTSCIRSIRTVTPLSRRAWNIGRPDPYPIASRSSDAGWPQRND
jgi:hypothetical protein